MTSRQRIADDLARARTRTLRLVDFDDAELCRQYDPLMSPLVWDLAHIGQQEELWLLRGGDPSRPGILPLAVEGLALLGLGMLAVRGGPARSDEGAAMARRDP